MRTAISLALSVLMAGGLHSQAAGKFDISRDEQRIITMEADDFIDALPEGLQDRQRIAVEHAMRGDMSSLKEIRGSRNEQPQYPAGVEIKDIIPTSGAAAGLKMRLYTPSSRSNGKLPLLVYFHGGGWTFGSLNSCGKYCASVAATGEAIVLAVEYSLAPEDPFPAALFDCSASVEYAAKCASEWGSDASLISLGGDSAGGNLALSTALLFADDSEDEGRDIAIRSLVLFYPVVSNTIPVGEQRKKGSWNRYGRGYGLDSRLMETFVKAYVPADDGGVATEGFKTLLEPLKAEDRLWRRLPPMLIVQAGRDILYDQGKEYIEQSRNKGIEVENVEFTGAVHLFITVEGQSTAFAKAVDLTVEFIKKV